MRETRSLAALLTPVTRGHLIITLEYLAERSGSGMVAAQVVDTIDEYLPAHAGVATSAVVEHARAVGLISAVIDRDGFAKFFIHAAALDLLGLDIEVVHGDDEAELHVLAGVFASYQHDADANNSRVWRAVASLMLLLDAEVGPEQIARLGERAVGNQQGPSTAKAFWLAESQFGLQIGKAEGFIDEPADGSLRITDCRLTDLGRAWLAGDGSPIAASVRSIELRGVL